MCPKTEHSMYVQKLDFRQAWILDIYCGECAWLPNNLYLFMESDICSVVKDREEMGLDGVRVRSLTKNFKQSWIRHKEESRKRNNPVQVWTFNKKPNTQKPETSSSPVFEWSRYHQLRAVDSNLFITRNLFITKKLFYFKEPFASNLVLKEPLHLMLRGSPFWLSLSYNENEKKTLKKKSMYIHIIRFTFNTL